MYRDSGVIKKPLLQYSENEERATLIDDGDGYLPMAPRKKKSGKKKGSKKGKKKGIRVTKGKISIKVPGYSGGQKFSASEILPFIAVSKVKAAAKRILSKSGKKKSRKTKKKKKTKKSSS